MAITAKKFKPRALFAILAVTEYATDCVLYSEHCTPRSETVFGHEKIIGL
jgi:hypothetical protein